MRKIILILISWVDYLELYVASYVHLAPFVSRHNPAQVCAQMQVLACVYKHLCTCARVCLQVGGFHMFYMHLLQWGLKVIYKKLYLIYYYILNEIISNSITSKRYAHSLLNHNLGLLHQSTCVLFC